MLVWEKIFSILGIYSRLRVVSLLLRQACVTRKSGSKPGCAHWLRNIPGTRSAERPGGTADFARELFSPPGFQVSRPIFPRGLSSVTLEGPSERGTTRSLQL